MNEDSESADQKLEAAGEAFAQHMDKLYALIADCSNGAWQVLNERLLSSDDLSAHDATFVMTGVCADLLANITSHLVVSKVAEEKYALEIIPEYFRQWYMQNVKTFLQNSGDNDENKSGL